jgi:hypothetical protein
VRIPIACTLTAEAAHDRVDEWRQFFARRVTATESTDQQEFRFRLEASTQALCDAVDLAQREKACCTFFEFSIQVETKACWLVVRVPLEASAVLADFVGLVPGQLRIPSES